ncbi:hypothetical protein [Streptomyces sp. NEAU-W12]|uniref:hypothetical protein n=1 Tax=Streptomyces sp. NEAU-W12 TaxID=2994668 RepID=UPI00224A8D93|nr:hypothetical protein [Streptomyces sp. NEAU-W12]MCX2925161.1 hypothetical protein [Streptomyces sp. NEAU-W12]
MSETASTPATIAAAALTALRVRGVAVAVGVPDDPRARMILLVLRITAPFFVPRRTPSTVPCALVYAREVEGGKSASRVKSGIVTAS